MKNLKKITTLEIIIAVIIIIAVVIGLQSNFDNMLVSFLPVGVISSLMFGIWFFVIRKLDKKIK